MNINANQINIFYVCGRDHCDKCHLWTGVYGFNGVVAKTLVVPRPDGKNNNNSRSRITSNNCIVVNVPQFKMNDDRSSTQVRQSIKNSNGYVRNFKEIDILHPDVLQYIKTNWSRLYRQLQ